MNITLNNEKWYSYCDPQYEYVIQSLAWITPIYDNSLCQAELPSGLTDDSRAKYENCTGWEPEAICIIPHCGNCFEPSEWRLSALWARAHPTLPVIGWCSKPEKSQPLKATSAGQSSIGEVKIINCQKRAYPQWYVGPSSGSEPGSRPKPRPRPRLVANVVFDHWKLITIHQNICRIKHIIHGIYSCTTV